jgi:hypothetical protein
VHAALDDGVFDAEHFGNFGFHGGAPWIFLWRQRVGFAAL